MMRTFRDVEFKGPPLMFAAWPGMGNVGIIAIDYLRTKLGATAFAEIDMTPFFIPDSIIVKDGIAQLPEIPGAVFHYISDPAIIFFESSAQITIIKAILDMAAQFKVKTIFTAAAFSQSMSHTEDSEVMAACNNPALIPLIAEHSIEPMPEGQIAGQNGLLLGIAASQSIDACCVLGTIPSFAANLSYPKAALSVLKSLESIIGVPIDLCDLAESVALVDQHLAAIEERIREYFPQAIENGEDNEEEEDSDQEQIREMSHDEVPRYIMDKIERLFTVVGNDRSKAADLKNELDRWNLYELYEHRFLDIFRKKNDIDPEDDPSQQD